MPEAPEILQRIYIAGFELQTFDRFPRAIGVIRGNCIALLQPSAAGVEILGRPGWRLGEAIGVLTTKDDRRVFQAKDALLEATPERLEELTVFERDLAALIQNA